MESPIKVIQDDRPRIRGTAALRQLQRPFLALDRLVERALPATLNPFAQTGAIANVSFIVAVVSGVLLLFWYTPSVGEAWSSLDGLDGLGQWMRSLHRYSSDATVFFVALHAFKLFFAGRFDGPRWVAWVTGLALVGLLWFVGWLGYWLVWDVRAQAIAVGTARFIEPLPIFTDPLSRNFLTDDGVSTALFFTVFFFHMLVPLAMGIALWMHISRVARARFLTSRAMTAWVVGAMAVASLAFPATSAEPAAMAQKLPAFTMDWWFLLPIAITERLGAGALWAIGFVGSILLISIPWTLVRKRADVAVVDLKRCNGCSMCAEDCPYGAIVMVPRTDGRGRYELQAQVDPDRCVGCGICAGSCNPGGIGLPEMPVQDKRKIVDQWIDAVHQEGEEVYIAFLCTNSAGGELEVGADGDCQDLPAFKCVTVPCSGWVHALTVERALRRGASGVIIVGCGCSDPPFREGPRWTEERLASHRDPGLRLELVDPQRVRFLKHSRGAQKALLADVAAFRAHTERQNSARPAVRSIAAGAVLATFISAIVLLGSDLPSTLVPDETPEVVVSMKYRPEAAELCRPATEAEKAQMLKHMRRETICERQKPDARLEIVIDGDVKHSATYPAHGLSSDGPSFAVVRIPVEPGEHDVRVLIGDTSHSEWTHELERDVVSQAGGVSVIEFTDR